MNLLLNGTWQFRQSTSKEWDTATVPGCNYLDLMALDKIPDPFDECNEQKVFWVAEQDWEYRKYVTLTASDLAHDAVLLHCDMLDTLCEVFVNGKMVGKGENCFLAYTFPVKEVLREGENEIRIYFHSPVRYVSEVYKKESAPRNANGQNGIVHIRKPQCHFGWDWGPVLPPSGISGDIELQMVDKAKIRDFFVEQKHQGENVTLSAEVLTEKLGTEDIYCEISVLYPNGTVVTESGTSGSFCIENPELWWTYELSGKETQPLYTVRAVLKSGEQILDTAEKKVGLRTITLNREKDEYGQNFQFILNGIPLFIKGANYIPPDSFINRFTTEKMEKLLDAVRYSNINMLRIWGGGFYGSDEFYDACDRRGILLWQDFQFACQAYPFFKEEFFSNVKKEVEYNVKRLFHHASLALWCGNNEIESMSMAWANMKDYIQWTENFFYHILEREIRTYDKATPYIPGSPTGTAYNEGIDDDNVGDTHLWAVWHGLQPLNYYRNRMTRFCSEFGFESLPDKKTIDTFAHSDTHALSDPIFQSHQKCNGGNEKMIYYIGSRFPLPKHFEDYVYLSQIAQMECVADATEHWRRNKGRCNGSMYWQLNDCWPVCSWASMDYYGNYKALQYAARRFNAPVSVSVEDTEDVVRVYALNDLTCLQETEVEYTVFDFEKGVLEEERKAVVLEPLENTCVFVLDAANLKKKYDPRRTGICACLYIANEKKMQKTVLFDAEKNLSLPPARLSLHMKWAGEVLKIAVTTDFYARFVQVESSLSTIPFEDDFFDLLPGQAKEISMMRDDTLSREEQLRSISVHSICDVERESNFLKAKWMQMQVFRSPLNVLGKMYYARELKKEK